MMHCAEKHETTICLFDGPTWVSGDRRTKPSSCFDPTHFLPPELVLAVFRQLADIDLCKAREVSKTWMSLIDRDHPLSTRLLRGFVIKSVNTLAQSLEDPGQKAMVYAHIAKVDPWESAEMAKKVARAHKYCEKDFALRTIAKAQAKQNSLLGLETAEEISIPEQRFYALLDLAKIDPEIGYSKAAEAAHLIEDDFDKARALIELAKFDPRHDFRTPFELARRVEHYVRDSLFGRIVEAQALHDLKGAKRVVRSIKGRLCRIFAHLEIAINDPEYNFEKILKKIEKFTETFNKDNAYFNIVKIQAARNIKAAKKVAQLIKYPDKKALARLEILKNDPKKMKTFDPQKDLRKILKNIEKWSGTPGKNSIYSEVVEILVHQNVEGAKQVAEWMINQRTRDLAQSTIACALAKHDLREGRRMIDLIADPARKIFALVKLFESKEATHF